MNGGFTDREAIGMLHGFLPWDAYIKAGRMFPAYGLRVWDDSAYIRSQTGYTFATPEEGGEIGFAPGPFFFATTITNGRAGDKDVAVTANGYGVWTDVPIVRNILAGMSFARQSPKRQLASWYAGTNVWNLTALAEFDLIDDNTVAAQNARDQFASYAELNWLLFEWLNLRGTAEFLKVSRDQNRTRYAIGFEPFIDKYLQPRIQYRINNGPERNVGLNQAELLVELHLWF
jgi:hypothetical protein